MIPTISLFGKTISVYMILAVIGILITLLYGYKSAQKNGLDEIEMLYTLLWSFTGALLGGHLLYALVNFDLLRAFVSGISDFSSFREFLGGFALVFGGSVFYGGLIGALGAAYLYMKKKRLSLGQYADIGAPAIPLFHTFGRIGCFLSGCCYGVESPFGFVYYHSAVDSANGVPRFPVQLVEALCNLIFFLILNHLLRRGKCQGKLIAVYLILYTPTRFLLEFLRGDNYRGFLGPLSTSQLLSVVLFIPAILYLIIRRKKRSET